MFLVFALLAAAASDPASTTTDPDPNDPVICRRQNAELGTHMRPKRICLHKSDWDIIEKHAQRELQNLHDKHLDPGRAEGQRPQ